MGKIDYHNDFEDDEPEELHQPLSNYQDFLLNVDKHIKSLRYVSKKSTELFVDIKDLKEEIDENKANEMNFYKYLKEYNRILKEFKELLKFNE
jgi:hypothetical protein